MNVLQAARQIRFKLLARTWPDAPAGPVFANVYVSQGPAEELEPSSVRFPFALVRVLDGTTDRDDQRFQTQRFEVVIVAQNSGDQFGEGAMVGANRASQGRSAGRGVLELEEQVLQALQFLDQTSAVRLQLMSAGTAEAVFTPDVGYVVARPLTFAARLTTDRSYPTPNAGRLIRATVTAGVSATLSWTWHERFDLFAARSAPATLTTARGQLLLVRKVGAVAPATVSDGTVVALSSNAATTVTDATGAGTFSYALFALYDEFGDGSGSPLTGTSVRTSTAATVTGIVV